MSTTQIKCFGAREYAAKQKTRALYEQAFDDPKPFVDYYYEDKCRDNIVVTKEEDGRILSMCHLNPYRLMVCGRETPAYYIVAVATERTRRHEGHMTDVLRASFALMQAQKLPFCYLMPMDTAIYEWLGFHVICDYTEAGSVSGDMIGKRYDIYCLRDENYLRRARKERRLAEADADEVLPPHPVIMAKIIDRDAFRAVSGLEKTATEKDCIAWLRSRRICICEEV